MVNRCVENPNAVNAAFSRAPRYSPDYFTSRAFPPPQPLPETEGPLRRRDARCSPGAGSLWGGCGRGARQPQAWGEWPRVPRRPPEPRGGTGSRQQRPGKAAANEPRVKEGAFSAPNPELMPPPPRTAAPTGGFCAVRVAEGRVAVCRESCVF